MPDNITIANHSLRLNGVGFRKLFLVNVYKAYLYTTESARTRETLYAINKPIRLKFEYVYGPIARERLAQAWTDAIDKVAIRGHLEAPLQEFLETLTDYDKGDVVTYDFLPTGELCVYASKNTIEPLVIHSAELCRVMLEVVFGTNPIDKSMKRDLLRGHVDDDAHAVP